MQTPEAVPTSFSGTDSLAQAKPMMMLPEAKPAGISKTTSAHRGNGRKMMAAHPSRATPEAIRYRGFLLPMRSDQLPSSGPPSAQETSSIEVIAAAVLESLAPFRTSRSR